MTATSSKLPLALRIEIEENAQRKALTQSELATQQKQLLDELRKHKTPGKRTDLDGTPASGKAEVRLTGIVGKIFNEGHAVVEKRLAVVAAAKAEPGKFGKLVEAMDATDRVDRAFKQLAIRRRDEHAKRTERGCTVNDLTALAASGRRFGVISADPPLPFEGALGSFMSRADYHYGTSSVAEIMQLPVASLAADDCALLLWCTGPHIAIYSRRGHPGVGVQALDHGVRADKRKQDRRQGPHSRAGLLDARQRRGLLSRYEGLAAAARDRREAGRDGSGRRTQRETRRGATPHRAAVPRSVSRALRAQAGPQVDGLGR